MSLQFSDTTDKLGIIQACERYCRLGDASISGNSSLLKEFTAHVNSINRRVWHTIFMSYGGWQYDDGNQTDLPAAAETITADKVSYALPSGALTVRGIEIKDSAGIWHSLKPINEEQIREFSNMGEFLNNSGYPEYYQLVGETVRLYPAANYTQIGSFKVFFDRGSVNFASGDTTKIPGFASEYHDILAIGASFEWLKINMPGDATTARLEKDYEKIMREIRSFYIKRYQENFPPRMTVKDQIRDYA